MIALAYYAGHGSTASGARIPGAWRMPGRSGGLEVWRSAGAVVRVWVVCGCGSPLLASQHLALAVDGPSEGAIPR